MRRGGSIDSTGRVKSGSYRDDYALCIADGEMWPHRQAGGAYTESFQSLLEQVAFLGTDHAEMPDAGSAFITFGQS
jgi:coenzyme F420-reducing hydrogenase beta subunit